MSEPEARGPAELESTAGLYEHARPIIDPERQADLDRRFVRAREVAVYRDIDRDMEGIPIEPAGPPDLKVFEDRAAELTPDDASDPVRAGIAQIAAFAQHRAERQWNRQQAEAGVAALDWVGKNPGRSFLAIPLEIRDWLAPDQWRGLEALLIESRPRTDRDLFERLDGQMVYEPSAFSGVDLDRHRLSLDDEDHALFAGARKAIVEGTSSPAFVRYRWTRIGIDKALDARGIDTDSSGAAEARADARNQLDSFETIEGRAPNGEDIDGIVMRAIGSMAETAVVREPSDPFDPQHIAPASGGRPPSRPPAPPNPRPAPGPGHNNPPRPLSPYEQAIENTRRLMRPSPPAQPPPDTAGPAASAAGDETRSRQDGETTSSEPVAVKDLTRLSPGEIQMLKKGSFDIHGEKRKGNTGPLDLFKDREGNIYSGRQDGQGEAEPIYDNIKNYR